MDRHSEKGKAWNPCRGERLSEQTGPCHLLMVFRAGPEGCWRLLWPLRVELDQQWVLGGKETL